MAVSVIVLDATLKGENSNSYLTLADAEVIIHQHPHHGEWDKITDDDIKKAAILWATRILNHFKWMGSPTTEVQALAWPRSGIYDMDGRAQDEDFLPRWFELACAELTYQLAVGDLLNDTGTEGFSQIKIGPIDLSIDPADRPNIIPDYIKDAISPWLYATSKYSSLVGRA